MFNLYHWELYHRQRLDEANRRAAEARLLADFRRSHPRRPGVRQRALYAVGALLIALGRVLQGLPAQPECRDERPIYA